MGAAHFIKQNVLGIHFPQEYICVGRESFRQPLRVALREENGILLNDVTSTHLLLGYKPLLIGIYLSSDEYPDRCNLTFDFEKESIAEIRLEKISMKPFGKTPFAVYKAVHGNHSLVPRWQQLLNTMREKLRKKSPGNVSLDGNLYEQVRIAYSVPRIISAVTLSDGNRYNLFPTDLHGAINENRYVDSLRIGGKAGRQVEEAKRIVISDVGASFFHHAYELGKNHTRDLQPAENFPFSKSRSHTFNLPLPE